MDGPDSRSATPSTQDSSLINWCCLDPLGPSPSWFGVSRFEAAPANMAAAPARAVHVEPADGTENEPEPSVAPKACRPKVVLGRFAQSFRLWRQTLLEADMHRRLQRLRPLYEEEEETVLLEDPSRTAAAVSAGIRIREEAAAVANLEPRRPGLAMQFALLVQHGDRLSLANFQILELLEALRES